MPAFLAKLVARAMAYGLSRALITWFIPFAHGQMVAHEEDFNAVVDHYLDADYLNALVTTWYPRLPESRTFRVFGRTVTVPIRAVLSPTVLILLLKAAATEERSALATARVALKSAYYVVLTSATV